MKKAILILLCVSLCALTFMSCGGENQGTADNPEAGSDSAGEETSANPEAVAEEAKYMGYVFPETQYDDYEFKILNFEIQDWAYFAMDTEEETGDVINDAMYERNAIVEENLGIKITDIIVPWGGMNTPLTNSINAGTKDYDVAMLNAYSSGVMAQQGMFMNLNDIASLNLDGAWWDKNANESLEIAGKLYFTTTDANASTYDLMATMFFNKSMLTNLALEDPYKLVLDKKWTMDKLLEMMRAAANDIDGDGIFTYNDIWGLSTHAVQDAHYFTGGGMVLINKDSNGYPVLNAPSEQFTSVYAKVREIFNLSDAEGLLISAGSNEGKIQGSRDGINSPEGLFMAGNSLFLGQCLSIARMMRSAEIDFGIIPHPKYNETQENYYALMDPNFATLTIPVTQDNPEMAGTVMNALTAVSSTTLKPAYYDVSLNNQLMRDEESIAMLDIEMQNRVYDLAMIYAWGGISDAFRQAAFAANGENPMTVYERLADKTQSEITKMTDSFNTIN
jgi:hypothetical protein